MREYPREISQEIIRSFSPPQELGIAEVDFEKGKIKYLDRKVEDLAANESLAGSMKEIKEILSK
ncbi:MAG: hypothetical protein ACE5JK_07545, partial [Candidatus Omnitrophota bacterium]